MQHARQERKSLLDIGSWLQISSAEHAFLADLLALSGESRLDQVLGQLFRGPALILSMDASQDFKKLAGGESVATPHIQQGSTALLSFTAFHHR